MAEGDSLRPGPVLGVNLETAKGVNASGGPAGLTGDCPVDRGEGEGEGGQEREEESRHFCKLHNSFAENSFIFQSYLSSALDHDVTTFPMKCTLKIAQSKVNNVLQ